MATDHIAFPSLSLHFWGKGTLEYINPNEKNYQRSFLLLVSCISSLGHELEKKCSYNWSASVRLNSISKALVSASHYWRVYDFTNGIKSGIEKFQSCDIQECLFKVMGAFSSIAILINELYNRGVIEGIPMDSLKLGSGILGTAVYFRKSVINWVELGTPSEERDQVKLEARYFLQQMELLRDTADVAMYVTIFAIKLIGLAALTASQTQLKILRLVIDYQARWLLGCFAVAMGTSLISHYSDCYIDRFVELNKR